MIHYLSIADIYLSILMDKVADMVKQIYVSFFIWGLFHTRSDA